MEVFCVKGKSACHHVGYEILVVTRIVTNSHSSEASETLSSQVESSVLRQLFSWSAVYHRVGVDGGAVEVEDVSVAEQVALDWYHLLPPTAR